MKKDEILNASRKEHRNKDLAEMEVVYQAGSHASRVGALVCCLLSLLSSMLAHTISQSEKESELKSVHDRVKKLTGYEMFLFRPPYGAYDNAVIKTAYQMNYYPIQWSVDSLDWKDYGVDSIIDTVCNHKALGPGAIILCPNGAKYTAEALDTMLTQLEEKGYTIVPISELIMRENYHMDVSGKQIADE